MVERVEKLININAREVMKSPELYLELLKLYSILFLNGRQPSDCGKCAYNYFNKLKTSGIKKALFMEHKTCKLTNKIFNVRVGNAIITYSDANVNDIIARRLLMDGKLKESDFITLPEPIVVEKTYTKKTRKPRTKK